MDRDQPSVEDALDAENRSGVYPTGKGIDPDDRADWQQDGELDAWNEAEHARVDAAVRERYPRLSSMFPEYRAVDARRDAEAVRHFLGEPYVKVDMAEDPPASDEETDFFAAEEAADRPARLLEFGVSRDEADSVTRLDCE